MYYINIHILYYIILIHNQSTAKTIIATGLEFSEYYCTTT